ncbi:DUF1641 domain-containing protein [Halostella litorea]|uniref:DUF1641 domain-containing protein n=1 Tax=Halostella litorea TaxID=2528831 RepID=UPI001091ED5D|nr:DUF1641 domain-containing protein [Halostella litorea]
MAEPRDAYPETATKGGRDEGGDAEGEAALRAALAEHGEDLAGVVGTTDEIDDLLTTAILVIASADDEEVQHVTESTANLVKAADGLSTDGAADLAAELGDSADDLAVTLDTVLELQRAGHLDDLVTIATAFSESLSPGEVEELATTLEDNGDELVGALDVVLELQREDQLEDLVTLAKTFSAIEADADTVRGLNTVLAAVGEAERESEPVGVLGLFRKLRGRDARAGLGYLVSLLKAQGRRLRNDR